MGVVEDMAEDIVADRAVEDMAEDIVADIEAELGEFGRVKRQVLVRLAAPYAPRASSAAKPGWQAQS